MKPIQTFSFRRLMNAVKGLGKPHSADDVMPDWLEKAANPKERKEWEDYLKHYKKVGVRHPKVKYPV